MNQATRRIVWSFTRDHTYRPGFFNTEVERLRVHGGLTERNCSRRQFARRVLALVVSHLFPLFLSFSLSLSYAVHKVYY